MTDHPLDRAVWNSLSSSQQSLAVGSHIARRYPTDVSPFAGVKDESAESHSALDDLIGQTGAAVVVQPIRLGSMHGVNSVWQRALLQMIFSGEVPTCRPDPRIELLRDSDAPAMLSLARLAKPGPFEARTIAMGRYWGIKQGGDLVAMAGERLRQTGYTEISGVCVHPDHRGRGLGRALSLHAIGEIMRDRNRPYLHTFADNQIAIALYTSLGFRPRYSTTAMALEPK